MEHLEEVEKPQSYHEFNFPQNKIYDIHNNYPIIAQNLTLVKGSQKTANTSTIPNTIWQKYSARRCKWCR